MVGSYLAFVRLLTTSNNFKRDLMEPVLAGAFTLLMVLQIADSFRVGAEWGKRSRFDRTEAADILVNFPVAPTGLITRLYPDPGILRERAAIAAKDRLSVFATRDAAAYSAAGIVPGGQVGRTLPIPLPLALFLQQDGSASRAWNVLSSVYFARPDLQATFPQTSGDYIRKLLKWATTSGIANDAANNVYLLPYKDQLLDMSTIIFRSAR
jgi:hypothetical protein